MLVGQYKDARELLHESEQGHMELTMPNMLVKEIPVRVVVVTESETVNADAATSSQSTITVVRTITLSTVSSKVTTTLQTLATTDPVTFHLVETTSALSDLATANTTDSIIASGTLSGAASVSSLLSSSSLSNRLGLAIGIPFAVVSCIGLAVLALVYLRKRMTSLPAEKRLYSGEKPGHSELDLLTYDRESCAERKPNILKRMSKFISMPDSPVDFKSPVFLRRFNLSSKNDKALPEAPEAPAVQNPYEAPASTPTKFPERGDTPGLGVLESLYVVVKPYARRLGDELTVCIGEKVTIIKCHTEGWATVRTVEGGDIGVIPLMCLRKKT